ncbi:C-C motif chemokine 13-like [Elgaria multicarinata webbii]|uniref:C-C motif chemokine 13-like n=1 Tax=Elgaria multicarinata webbii TaxID=159646 RepID=UPI002FCCC221
MKTAALAVFLVITAFLPQAKMRLRPVIASCCFSYPAHHLSLDQVSSFKHTDKRCPERSVIFLTKNGRQICADPKKPWVQDLIDAL